jgi:zinc transport system substrate-binding protein
MILATMKKIFSIFLCLLCFGCASTESSKPKILVTIPPYAGFVKSLTEGQVDVEIFVPPGSNPHAYEPTPEQVKRFTQAKIWFRIGDPIETKMVAFLQPYNVDIVNISSDWATLDEPHTYAHQHEDKDLHVWMDPVILSGQVEEITLHLSNQFPEMASMIRDNCDKIKSQLDQLNSLTTDKLAPFQGRYLLVSHPALGYYCARYRLNQLSVEVEGKDPRPQDIAALMNTLKTHPVPVVLIEPQYNKKGAILIADKLHVPYEEINPYARDYFGMFNQLTNTIVKFYDHSNS